MKRKHQVREKISAERSFKQDPHKFASKLFEKQQRSGSPSFSAETAFKYFQETYTAVERDFIYTAPEGMQRPNPPNFIFSIRCPTHAEICKSIRRKRNGSSPGLNAITYVPYKKCKSLQKFVVKFARKIWRKKDIPADWAQAFIVLLSKSQDLATVSEFRPIAITCTVGKIFFSVVADRLQLFMLKNNFISREIQKGFLAGVPGCIEHTFALFEALRDSKQHYRQLVITWIDLANGYVSVRHNLIQFAPEWY